MSRPFKIVHGTSAHSAIDARILERECRFLAERGYDVTLVAPNASAQAETGSVRIRSFGYSGRRLRRMTIGSWRCYRTLRDTPADLYHLHDPELLWALPLLKRSGVVVVYDSHEDLPKQILHKGWIPRVLRPAVAMVARVAESLLLRFADGVVVPISGMAERSWPAPVTVVANFPIVEDYSPPANLSSYESRPPTAAYVGAVSLIRGAVVMVEAAGLLAEEGFRLVIAGGAEPGILERMSSLKGWARTDWLGYRMPSEIPGILGEARVGLVLLQSTPSYTQPYATKMFEYMAAGIPFVASSMESWVEVLEGWDCCLFADPLDGADVADKVKWLLGNPEEAHKMGQRGRAIVRDHFSFASEADSLSAFYERLLA